LSVAREITDFKKAEEELRMVHRALVTLSSCGRAITHAQSEKELLTNVCCVIVKKGGYSLAWVGYAEYDENKTIRPVGQWGYEAGYLEKVNITWREDAERGRGPSGTAFRTGTTTVIRDTLSDPRFTPWRDEASKRGYSSVIGIPLADDKGGRCGVITIYAANLAYGIMALRARNERAIAEQDLRKTRDELELRVQERTKELSLANEILEREISERRKMEKDLRASYEKLKSPTFELARVEDNERKRISGRPPR
jgi:hypothetical protein